MRVVAAPHALTDTERRDWWRLSRTAGVGPMTFFRLIERYGTASAAIDALPHLSKRGGRATPLVAFDAARSDDEISNAIKQNARLIAACEPDYPTLLRNIDDAPPVIMVKGNPEPFRNRPVIGMVGARNASLPGRKMAATLARDLGARGYVVASGLARGIDTSAHEGSIATGTIAVVAGGVDILYPPENQKLYDDIATRGLILSEHPCGTEPKSPYFPRRNRIISGVSRGVVVVEASINSGSLITARCALEQGRDVFAVPGSPMDPRAGGPNQLIRDGAVLIERADHVVDALSMPRGSMQLFDSANTPYESPAPDINDARLDQLRPQILEDLTYTPVSIDDLARTRSVNIAIIQAILLELELAGIIERLPGNRVVRLAMMADDLASSYRG